MRNDDIGLHRGAPHLKSDSSGQPFSWTGKGHTLNNNGTALVLGLVIGAAIVLAGAWLWSQGLFEIPMD